MDENNREIDKGIEIDINLKKNITSLASRLAGKLNKEIAKGNDDAAFMIAFFFAALKDFLDFFIAITLLEVFVPGASFVIGLFLTSFLYFFMLGKGWFLKWKIKVMYWVLGLFVDGIPLFSALPINLLLVIYAWRITKRRAENGKLKLKNLDNLTNEEMLALDNDISILESKKTQTV